jgi:hypothetical protein
VVSCRLVSCGVSCRVACVQIIGSAKEAIKQMNKQHIPTSAIPKYSTSASTLPLHLVYECMCLTVYVCDRRLPLSLPCVPCHLRIVCVLFV